MDCAADDVYLDSVGRYWQADKPYEAGSWGHLGDSTVYETSREILGTNDGCLYQTLRFAYGSFGYQFDVPNGVYEVELHFAEVWHRSAGNRAFDVIIEGQTVLDDYDVFAVAGWCQAVTVTHPVTVSDGQLNLIFAPGPADLPMISALAVTKTG